MLVIEVSLYAEAAQLAAVMAEKKVQEFYSILYYILFGRSFGLQSSCGMHYGFSLKKYRRTEGENISMLSLS